METPLYDRLVCPLSKTPLRRQGDLLISDTGIQYPIKNDVPILLPSAAILPPNASAALKAQVAASPNRPV